MNVVLINPPLLDTTKRGLGPVAWNLFYNSAPLGLLYIASFIRKKGHKVSVIDAAAEGLSAGNIIKRLEPLKPSVVGITTLTVSAVSAYRLARDIKRAFPAVRLIAGGPHVTSHPEDMLKHRVIEAAVIGEGEITFSELLESLEKGKSPDSVKGLAFVRDGRLIRTLQREYITDLDSLPFPARDLVPIRRYRPQPNDQKTLPKLSMITSRGCPYSCIFCDKSVFRSMYRSFTPSYIAKEMRQLKDEYNARDIAFVDSTFTPSKERVLGITEAIKIADLGITWTCSVRADVLDRETLKDMKEAGCWRVRIGVESGNEEVLKFIKKGITKEQVRRVARWAYELDLEPKGFFMVGHLTDTKRTIRETISFARSLPFKDVTVQINTPLANTPQSKLAEKYGTVRNRRDRSDYTLFEPVFVPYGMTRQELLRYQRLFYLVFYLRPSLIYWHLKKIRRLSDINKYIEGAKLILFMAISWIKEKFS